MQHKGLFPLPDGSQVHNLVLLQHQNKIVNKLPCLLLVYFKIELLTQANQLFSLLFKVLRDIGNMFATRCFACFHAQVPFRCSRYLPLVLRRFFTQ